MHKNIEINGLFQTQGIPCIQTPLMMSPQVTVKQAYGK